MTNTSERLAKRILGGTLAGSGWAFAMKIRLQDVLVLDGLHGDDYLLYTTGHFDFVVCRSSDGIPVFAIEIDGLSHEDPKQIKRDIIKNRLCATAGLPLIRLGIDALDESQEISILEWLVERFVTWQEQSAAYKGDSISPFVHNVALPFPGNLVVAERLFNRFGIATRWRDFEVIQRVRLLEHSWLAKGFEEVWSTAPYRLEVLWPAEVPTLEDGRVSEDVVCETVVELRTRAEPARYLLKTIGKARFGWAHKTNQATPTPPHSLIPSVDELRKLGLAPIDLPWFEASGVADELATFNALLRVEDWTERNHLAMKTAVLPT